MYGEVLRVQVLTPQLVRVVLGGEGLAGFVDAGRADSYVNLQFLPPGVDYAPPFDAAAVRERPREQQPSGRRYTVRAWDALTRELTIDFVVHGDEGLAGRWAQSAAPGDRIQFTGPGGGYDPDPEADWYLLVGDESALPAIAVAAERAPAGKPLVVVLEIEDEQGRLALPGTVTWVMRNGRQEETLLLEAVQRLDLPVGRCDAFVHGEAVATRRLRTWLLSTGVVAREHLSVSPYWRHGYTDEQWRQVKAAWQRDVENDVLP
jgi:NADPH-dependent ferric siderophore reductase